MALNNYLKRIRQASILAAKEDLNAYLVEDPVDLFYFTGMNISRGILFTHPVQSMLFVDGRYFEICSALCPIDVCLESPEAIEAYLKSNNIFTVGYNGALTSTRRLLEWQNKYELTFKDVSINEHLRIKKDEDEIKYLQQSADLLWRCFKHVESKVKEGITEKQLALEFEFYAKSHGADSLAFDPIIAFGAHSCLPHHRPFEEKLKKNTIILIDIGVQVNGYCSDMTRTIAFGDLSKELQNIQKIVKQAYDTAVHFCKEGVLAKDVDKAARKFIADAGYAEFFIHSLGHGVGLQVHESPYISSRASLSSLPLKNHMVFTIEPGIYLPGVGGVRYENTLYLQDGKAKSFFPHDK